MKRVPAVPTSPPDDSSTLSAEKKEVQSLPARKEFTLWERLQIAIISRAGWLLIWLINSTVRFRVEGWETIEEANREGRPVVLSFWHNQIFSATYFWRFRGIVVMTSSHFDGEYIARIIRLFGYGTARGSSSRGAIRALLQLQRRLGEGKMVAFTIDGPRGPVYKVKPGPVWLSRKTRFPIVCFHIQPRKYWQLKSWDGFRIPKPFTRTLVKIGQPLAPPPDGDDDSWLVAHQEEMDRLRYYCENYQWD